MPAYLIRVRQHVYYDVEIKADTFAAARRIAVYACTAPLDGKEIAAYDMTEVDQGPFFVDIIQPHDPEA